MSGCWFIEESYIHKWEIQWIESLPDSSKIFLKIKIPDIVLGNPALGATKRIECSISSFVHPLLKAFKMCVLKALEYWHSVDSATLY